MDLVQQADKSNLACAFKISRDSETVVAILWADHIAKILERYLENEIDASGLEAWANTIECREAIGINALHNPKSGQFIHELANPVLFKPITRERVNQMANESLTETRRLLENWQNWSKTADHTGDGWECSFPDWNSMMILAANLTAQPGLSVEDFKFVEKCWQISQEGEVLADHAKDHIQTCWPTLVRLADSKFPEVRWQVYEVLGEAEMMGDQILRAGLDDIDGYCRRRAILSLARLNPADAKELASRFANDLDPYIRQAAKELLKRQVN